MQIFFLLDSLHSFRLTAFVWFPEWSLSLQPCSRASRLWQDLKKKKEKHPVDLINLRLLSEKHCCVFSYPLGYCLILFFIWPRKPSEMKDSTFHRFVLQRKAPADNDKERKDWPSKHKQTNEIMADGVDECKPCTSQLPPLDFLVKLANSTIVYVGQWQVTFVLPFGRESRWRWTFQLFHLPNEHHLRG